MGKGILLNEIKLLELKLHVLKAMVAAEETKTKSYTSAHLYGLLKDSDDITAEDVDAVKMGSKFHSE